MLSAIAAFAIHYWGVILVASHAVAVWAGHKWASVKAAAKADLTNLANKL